MVTQSTIERGPIKRVERGEKIGKKKRGWIRRRNAGTELVSIKYVLSRPFHPQSKVLITPKPNKSISDAITVSENSNITPKTSLNLLHQLRMCHFGMDANGNKVIPYTVKDLNFHKRSLRIGSRYSWAVEIGGSVRVRSIAKRCTW